MLIFQLKLATDCKTNIEPLWQVDLFKNSNSWLNLMMINHRPVPKSTWERQLLSSDSTQNMARLTNKAVRLLTVWPLSGELYRRRDPWHHGPEEQHPEHVRDCSRRPRKIHADRLALGQGRYHRRSQGRRDPRHRHPKGRAGAVHHHQVHVSSKAWTDLNFSFIMMNNHRPVPKRHEQDNHSQLKFQFRILNPDI